MRDNSSCHIGLHDLDKARVRYRVATTVEGHVGYGLTEHGGVRVRNTLLAGVVASDSLTKPLHDGQHHTKWQGSSITLQTNE